MKKIILMTLFGLFGISAGAQDTLECDLTANFTYTVTDEILYLTNTSTDEPIDPYYTWTIDGLFSSVENPAFSTVDFEATEEVCLTVYDSLDVCMDVYCMTIEFEIDTIAEDTIACELDVNFTYTVLGETLFLTNTSTGEPIDPNYTWTVDGLSSSLENPSFSTVDFEAAEMVCLNISDSLGGTCHEFLCIIIVFEDSLGVDTTFCELDVNFTYTVSGETLFLTNTSTDEPVDPNYAWVIDGLFSPLENPSFSTVDFEATEEVCLTVYDSLEECVDYYCMTIIFEDDTLVGDSTFCELDVSFTFLRSEETIYFTNTSTDEPAEAMYTWYRDGWPVSEEENPSFDVTDFEPSSTMCLEIHSVEWDCYDSTCQVIIIDDIEIDSTASLTGYEKFTLEIYPNPVKDILNISLPNTNGNQQIVIYNTIGELILINQAGINNKQTMIDVSALPKGMYIIKIIDEENPSNSFQENFIKN